MPERIILRGSGGSPVLSAFREGFRPRAGRAGWETVSGAKRGAEDPGHDGDGEEHGKEKEADEAGHAVAILRGWLGDAEDIDEDRGDPAEKRHGGRWAPIEDDDR